MDIVLEWMWECALHFMHLCMQVNAVLLTISLGSLAKSQLGKTTSEMTTEKDERRKEYMEVGK